MAGNFVSSFTSALTSRLPTRIRPSFARNGLWDQILDELRRKTEDQVRRANQVKITGATGAYSAAFEAMEKQLVDIKRILDSATISNDDLVYVQSRINETDIKLDQTETKLKSLDSEVAGIKSSIMQASH